MASWPHPDVTAAQLQQLPTVQARQRLAELLEEPWPHEKTDPALWRAGLQRNALLVSCLRDRKVRLWGADPTGDGYTPCA